MADTNHKQHSMKPFWLLWSCQAASLLGSQAVQFALIWWLTIETGSAAILATAAIVGLLPQVLLGPVIGLASVLREGGSGEVRRGGVATGQRQSR